MDKETFKALLKRYEEGQCSPAEKARVESWFLQLAAAAPALDAEPDYLAIDADLQVKLGMKKPKHFIRPLYKWLSGAAALLIIGLGLFFVVRNPPAGGREDRKIAQITDIAPGFNQATLTLADGSTISLDSAQSGIIIQDEHIKYQNGESLPGVILSGERGNEGKGAEGSLPNSLSLTTPKGGQYQIILSDGTKVWLNAASTLKYPSRFSGDRREVFLEGEAYFEINNIPVMLSAAEASQKKGETHSTPLRSAQGDAKSVKPFIVKSKNQEILVLGTSFNVAAFADEKETKTTLVSGSVKVLDRHAARPERSLGERSRSITKESAIILSPGEQSLIQGDGQLTKAKVDVNSELAWKNGQFIFKNTPLVSLLHQLERWYDIEVDYSNLPGDRFYGKMSRNVKLSEVLHMLEVSSNIRFSIEGRRLVLDKK